MDKRKYKLKATIKKVKLPSGLKGPDCAHCALSILDPSLDFETVEGEYLCNGCRGGECYKVVKQKIREVK